MIQTVLVDEFPPPTVGDEPLLLMFDADAALTLGQLSSGRALLPSVAGGRGDRRDRR